MHLMKKLTLQPLLQLKKIYGALSATIFLKA